VADHVGALVDQRRGDPGGQIVQGSGPALARPIRALAVAWPVESGHRELVEKRGMYP